MKIPKSVMLMGTKVKVKPFQQKSKKDKQCKGLAIFSNKTIYLADVCRGTKISKDQKEHTFFHELLHQVLDSAGYLDLNADEQFVDVISAILHQALGPHMK